MCQEKLTSSKAKEDLQCSREEIDKSISEGENKLCLHIQRMIKKHIGNLTSSDGGRM